MAEEARPALRLDFRRRCGDDSWTVRLEDGKLVLSGGDYDDAHRPVEIDRYNWRRLRSDIDAVLNASNEPAK